MKLSSGSRQVVSTSLQQWLSMFRFMQQLLPALQSRRFDDQKGIDLCKRHQHGLVTLGDKHL